MNTNRYETAKKIISPEADLEEYLNQKMDEFFPDMGKWYMSCFEKPNELEISYLPCHLDDDEWLAKMLIEFCNLPQEKYKDVLSYVKISDVFYHQKKEYGLRVVKWQIGFINSGGGGYVLKDQHGGDFWQISDNCDKSFRWAVVDTLEAIGMNRIIIEEGLEKYSDDWRDNCIKHAFENKYEIVSHQIIDAITGGNDTKSFPDVSEDFKKAWIAMRKYEYYKEHRESVDLYGKVEPEMKISFKEYEDLKSFVESEASKRNDEINRINTMYSDSNQEKLNIAPNNTAPQKKKSFFSRFKK